MLILGEKLSGRAEVDGVENLLTCANGREGGKAGDDEAEDEDEASVTEAKSGNFGFGEDISMPKPNRSNFCNK